MTDSEHAVPRNQPSAPHTAPTHASTSEPELSAPPVANDSGILELQQASSQEERTPSKGRKATTPLKQKGKSVSMPSSTPKHSSDGQQDDAAEVQDVATMLTSFGTLRHVSTE